MRLQSSRKFCSKMKSFIVAFFFAALSVAVDARSITDDSASECVIRLHERLINGKRPDPDGPTMITDMPKHPAVMSLMTDPQKQKHAFIHPVPGDDPYPNNPMIRIGKGETINLSCPGTFMKAATTSAVSYISAKCEGNNKFSVDNNGMIGNWNFNELGCVQRPKESYKDNYEPCGPGDTGDKIVIGFNIVNDWTFQPLYEACIYKSTGRTIYVNHTLMRNIDQISGPYKRVDFTQEGYWNIEEKEWYTRDAESFTMDRLIGQDYFNSKLGEFFSKGHLAPPRDFSMKYFKDATFRYANAAPQRQAFNNANWKAIENHCRKYMTTYTKRDLDVYTGTNGVLKVEQVDIYLYFDQSQQKKIPVPNYFWKVLHNPDDKTGIALIGVNVHPDYVNAIEYYKTEACNGMTIDSVFLPDVSKRDDAHRGFAFACQIGDAKFEEIKALNLGTLPGLPGILN